MIENRKKIEEEKQSLQSKLQRTQKMESMGQLAGGVAHDLNNILSGIVGYPELLLMKLPEDSDLRKPIQTIFESGVKASAIVHDLLTISRGSASAKDPMSLNHIVNQFLNSPECENLRKYHPGVTLKTKLDASLMNMAGSEIHIKKVVMNLVSNASEAISGAGEVIISTENRYVDKPLSRYDNIKPGEYCVLSVSDNGPGIFGEDLEKIFEPFYTKKKMGRCGTGLGLPVVWNVVSEHDGYIDVKSGKGGTLFEVYFPITRVALSEKSNAISINAYKGQGERILVVDDVKTQREIVCEMLETMGYQAESVASGEDAISYLKERTADLIILDMIMSPGMSGREAYQKILEIHPQQKAIITSGFAETVDVAETQKMGAGKFLKKPVSFEKLGIAIKIELAKSNAGNR